MLGAASLAAIRLDPKNVQAYTGRAISYQKKGDIARAKVDYEKAPSLDPDAETRKDVQAALDRLGMIDAAFSGEVERILATGPI